MKNVTEMPPLLLVEDDLDDIEIMHRALKKANIKNPLYVLRNGEEAWDYLKRVGQDSSEDTILSPGLILLDLNMPRMDGRELLKRIKNDHVLKCIPTVVLTTSKYKEDILSSYQNGANSFITKPVHFKDFVEILETIGQYWLEIAEVPQRKFVSVMS